MDENQANKIQNHYSRLKKLYEQSQSDLKIMIGRYKKLEKENKKLKNELDKKSKILRNIDKPPKRQRRNNKGS